ncbi:hypothetical protein CHARACLAT_006743 [Characodon lateralis]|uniref:Uncharacterized protein n=1 Tax=Characodon lateralis TaxID=208331 RepID=A0ABU7DYC6_9TELE|nr:hypothetical protein [Characodon lateralis]
MGRRKTIQPTVLTGSNINVLVRPSWTPKLKLMENLWRKVRGGTGAYLQQSTGKRRIMPLTGLLSIPGQHTEQTTMHTPIPT